MAKHINYDYLDIARKSYTESSIALLEFKFKIIYL